MNEERSVTTILNLCPDLFCPWANRWTNGVGDKKLKKFGEVFMEAVREYEG